MNRKLFIATIALASLSASAAFAQAPRINRTYHQPHTVLPKVTSYSPASGLPGTKVTIYGNNFAANTQVNLGGMLITPIRLASGALQFTIPHGAKDGTIMLQSPYMRTSLVVGGFNVLSRGAVARKPYYGNQKSRSASAIKSRNRLYSTWDRAFLRNPQVKAELALHAERVAKLERMKTLAVGRRDAGLRIRITAALDKENARHARAMAALKVRVRV